MTPLTLMLQALLRANEAVPVAVSIGGTVFELSVGELATVVLAETDTRRTTVLGQPAGTIWQVHPAGADKPAFTLTPEEILHSVPYFQKTNQLVQTVKMVVNEDGLNVRAVPSSANNMPIATLARGTEVTVKVSTDTWKQIVTPDAYKNAWVHGDYLKVPQ
jgi:hypothetical protein